MMLGGYAALVVVGLTQGMPPVIALIVAVIGAGLVLAIFGAGVERALFSRTIRRPIVGFVVSLGLVRVLQNAVILKWGVNPQHVETGFSGILEAGGIYMTETRVLTFVTALALAGGFYLFLLRTTVGTALRACNVDREVAGLMGINVPRMQLLAFVLGSALAGGGGALLAFSYPITPFFGTTVIIKGFVVALAGGLGNVLGAFWVALGVGVLEALLAGFGLSSLSDAVLFTGVVFLLLLRPSGLLRGTAGSSVH
jgi:branched-chain amino acid transport system permease protein